MPTAEDTRARLVEIGANAMTAISEMVAALNVDYDRLEELREARDDWAELPEVDDDHPVTVLSDDDQAAGRATCGACGRSWDDSIVTSMTPAPGGRCPFEAFHANPESWATANPDDAEELAELEQAAGDCTDQDDARQRIQDDPLSFEVRSGWHAVGETLEPEEFCLLLATGGPAVRIIGDIEQHGELSRPQLQVQDWFTQWTSVPQDTADLESYISCFTAEF